MFSPGTAGTPPNTVTQYGGESEQIQTDERQLPFPPLEHNGWRRQFSPLLLCGRVGPNPPDSGNKGLGVMMRTAAPTRNGGSAAAAELAQPISNITTATDTIREMAGEAVFIVSNRFHAGPGYWTRSSHHTVSRGGNDKLDK